MGGRAGWAACSSMMAHNDGTVVAQQQRTFVMPITQPDPTRPTFFRLELLLKLDRLEAFAGWRYRCSAPSCASVAEVRLLRSSPTLETSRAQKASMGLSSEVSRFSARISCAPAIS